MNELKYKVNIEPMMMNLLNAVKEDMKQLEITEEEYMRAVATYGLRWTKEQGIPEWFIKLLSELE